MGGGEDGVALEGSVPGLEGFRVDANGLSTLILMTHLIDPVNAVGGGITPTLTPPPPQPQLSWL